MTELISVMIVDDEKLTLEDLCTIVDWEACGYKIVATAFNGRQALRKYKEFQPQLILTDIRMPFMDGIEMISEIRKLDEKVNIVLLTAYEEFSYAKAAISLGITEYLIKSEITESSMSELLQRLHSNIKIQDRKEKIVTDRMLEQFFLSDNLAKDQDIERYLQKMFHLILVEQDLPINISAEPLPSGIAIPKVKMVDMLSHGVYRGWKLDAITNMPGGQTVLALNRQRENREGYETSLFACGEYIKNMLTELTSCSFTVYVFENRTDLLSLKRYCDENKEAFLKKYFYGIGQVRALKYPFMLEKKSTEAVPERIDANEILNLRSNEEIEAYFKKLYQKIIQQESMEQLLGIASSCYYVLQKAYRELPGKMPDEDLSQERHWTNWLDAESICGWFTEQLEKRNTYIKTDIYHYSRPVTDTIEYIYKNYKNPDLSMNDIADHVHLSVGYLSGIFKKEAGVTLKNYITDVRINAAKRLMEKGNYRIYEICSEVGYHSSQYFSQAFYKKVGMFPTEYRKKE